MNAFKKYCMNKGLLNTSSDVELYNIEYSFNAERGYFVEHSDVMVTLVVVLRDGTCCYLDLSDFNTCTRPFAVYDWDAVHMIVELLQLGMIKNYVKIRKVECVLSYAEGSVEHKTVFTPRFWGDAEECAERLYSTDPDCIGIAVACKETIEPQLAAEIILDKVLRPDSWEFTDALNHVLFDDPTFFD